MNTNKNEPSFFLFTDGSVNPQTNIGYGAYLLIKEDVSRSASIHHIKTKRFENTSSTRLELETLLWALNKITLANCKIIVYTDCQNIIGLKNRQERFEKNNYMSKINKRIKNHDLYKEFYKLTNFLTCEFVKIKGHKQKNTKDEIDEIFTLVDKASRAALREANIR